MTDERLTRFTPGVIVDAEFYANMKDTIEQQSKLLNQALEALNSVVLYDYQGLPCGISNEWEKSILLSATVEAIKQFKEQK